MKEKEIMAVKQVAEYLQMDEHTVYKLARSVKSLPLKIAGQWRFKRSLIDQWIQKQPFKHLKGNDDITRG